MSFQTSISLLIAFAVTVTIIYLLIPLAHRIQLVDTPKGRKQHQGDVPLIGGIAMCFGFIAAILTVSHSLFSYRTMLAGSLLLVFIGILDDFRELNARARLIAQIIAACLMVFWGHTELDNLGNLFFVGNLVLGKFAIVLTIIAVVGMINAVNMTDGLDGLAGSLALIELAFISFLAWTNAHLASLTILILLMSVIVGFLLFNLPFTKGGRAKVFMGDAGSMFLGYILVWFLIELSQGKSQHITSVTMLWVMAIPLFDIGSVMLHRIMHRRSPFTAGREHIHHLFLHLGFSPRRTVLFIAILSIFFASIGCLGFYSHIAEGSMFIAFVCLFLAYHGLNRLFWRVETKATSTALL